MKMNMMAKPVPHTYQDIETVCVYCGASERVPAYFREAAAELGTGLAKSGFGVVYGGGGVGLMGTVADSALNAGGKVIGIIPDHLTEAELGNQNLTELIIVDSMHTRKRTMVERSDAFCVLPGGFGTMDEFFEILTWRQLNLHNRPIVIVNVRGYWDPLLDLLSHQQEIGFAPQKANEMFVVVDSVADALEFLEEAKRPTEVIETGQM